MERTNASAPNRDWALTGNELPDRQAHRTKHTLMTCDAPSKRRKAEAFSQEELIRFGGLSLCPGSLAGQPPAQPRMTGSFSERPTIFMSPNRAMNATTDHLRLPMPHMWPPPTSLQRPPMATVIPNPTIRFKTHHSVPTSSDSWSAAA